MAKIKTQTFQADFDTGVLDVNITGSSGSSTVTLGAGSAIAGKFGIDQTTPGTTNLVSIGSNGVVTLAAGVASIGTVILGAGSAAVGTVTAVGAAASGSAKSGNPLQLGAVFNTTPPTVTTGQAVELQTTNRGFLIMSGPDSPGNAPIGNPLNVAGRACTSQPGSQVNGVIVRTMNDKLGRTVPSTSHVRELVTQQATTISASTAETTIVTAVSATFNDLTMLTISNTSASTQTRIDIRSTTGGTILASYNVAGNSTVVLPFPTPFTQAAVNTNWTAQCSVSTTDVRIVAHAIQNI